MKKVQSSNVDTIHYEPDHNRLEVVFKGGGEYHYHDVSQHHYDALENAESVGKHLNTHIKGKFKATKK
jgi:hypothetical protein